jgi:hypothetical protein
MLRLLWVVLISSTFFLLVLVQLYPVQLARALAALALIVLFIIAIHYIHTRVPPFVVVGTNQIYRGLNDETADEWRYKNIDHCEFSTRVIDGNVYNAMVIATRNGQRSLVLIPLTVSIDALRSFLVSRGIAVQDGATSRCG